ncbi:MAG: PepSY-like domain-containing protein [Prevotella sp.]|nr:PepSY-like domain-containing protein [Prevotella sp.]
MKKIFFIIIAIFFCMVSVLTPTMADNKKPIQTNELPAAAQQIIKKHFADKKVAMANYDAEWGDKKYKVVFTSGESIEFNRKGEWTEIEGNGNVVPAGLIPQGIMKYVKANYPKTKITKIEKNKKSYEVKLSNRIELEFNNRYQVTDID